MYLWLKINRGKTPFLQNINVSYTHAHTHKYTYTLSTWVIMPWNEPNILLTNERPTWCHLLFYFTYYVLNMFRTLIYPPSGACDCVDELPHPSSCSQFVVCCSFWCGWFLMVFVLQASACKTNKTTDVVIHQHSRKLLMMDILTSETCWARKTWNKIASDIKLVFHSSTIAMMHGPINIRLTFCVVIRTYGCRCDPAVRYYGNSAGKTRQDKTHAYKHMSVTWMLTLWYIFNLN